MVNLESSNPSLTLIKGNPNNPPNPSLNLNPPNNKPNIPSLRAKKVLVS